MPDNVTCFECGADVAAADVAEANGRCVKCGFNIQSHRDRLRSDEVLKREADKQKKEDKPTPKPKRLW